MIVRTLEEIIGTDRDVSGPGWLSRRLILRRDGMGASVHDTTVKERGGAAHPVQAPLRDELLRRRRGRGGRRRHRKTYPIRPGTLYALDRHDEHILRATSGDLQLVCVFTPALSGTETHGPDGGYAPAEE